jgi:hypothetical protein
MRQKRPVGYKSCCGPGSLDLMVLDEGLAVTTGRISHIPPAPREVTRTSDTWVSLCVAVALGLAAVVIALWPSPQRAEAATQTEVPAGPPKAPLSTSAAQTALQGDSPTRFANPFDAAEIFEFPAGTTEDAARESVAEILFERARERGLQTGRVKRAHARQPTPLRIPRLVSKSIFKNAS